MEAEIGDSEEDEDENYDWVEEDEEEVPPMPPQWQGSEHILIPVVENEDGVEEEEVVDTEHEL